VLPQDVYDVSRDVLRHRVLLTFEALAEGTSATEVVERVVQSVVAPRVAPSQDDPILAVA
jgi:MoxR-like ATPase